MPAGESRSPEHRKARALVLGVFLGGSLLGVSAAVLVTSWFASEVAGVLAGAATGLFALRALGWACGAYYYRRFPS